MVPTLNFSIAKKSLGLLAAGLVIIGIGSVQAEKSEIVLSRSGTTGLSVQIEGDADDEWRLQGSRDLVNWTNVAAFGVSLSKGTNPPSRAIGNASGDYNFYRGLRTEGLYDTSVFRIFNLTFTNSNWATLLANGRLTGSNTPAMVTLDNGATNTGVGARYKGNTSYTMQGTKKSINLEFDYLDSNGDLMGFRTANLNNAAGDETIMREPLYFSVMSRYTVSPKASMARVFINGADWGVYSLAEQENKELIDRWFPSNDGDRWSTPNAAMGGTVGPGSGTSGPFAGLTSALSYQGGTNISLYSSYYYLKATEETNNNIPWARLVHAIDVLNNTPTAELRDKLEDAFAVDRWLWFLAIENIFTDDDSYFNKGADYGFYYEPETGRIHPVEHDGNEAFTAADVSLSPVTGATGTNRPLLYKLLPINELRQRYLAHMRTVLEESFKPSASYPLITNFQALSINAIIADPKKSYTMTAYTNDVTALKSFIAQRYAFLTNHAELIPLQPNILAVHDPATVPGPSTVPFITAEVQGNGTEGIDSVWVYYRTQSYGRFSVHQMFDDGAHGDGAAKDGTFGGATTNFPPGTKVRYYIEARAGNAAKAARFAPARAEEDTFSYRVGLALASNSPIVINELMAANKSTLADPQGEFDDWLELHNVTNQDVDLTGRYLSDEPNNPRKWQFPSGTRIPADGYLIVWLDEDGAATSGLHASFKLAATGEELFLIDTDVKLNAVLDSISFGAQETDRAFGRSSSDPEVWKNMSPTPGRANEP